MEYTKGRYSWLIRPILVIFDLFCVNGLAYYFYNFNSEKMYFFSFEMLNDRHILYLLYSIIFWYVSTNSIQFYKVYRYTSVLNILSLLVKQFFVYSIICFAFIGAFRSINSSIFITFRYLLVLFILIGFVKFLSYFALKSFRKLYNGNVRQIVIIGNNDSAKDMYKIASQNLSLGYNIQALFGCKAFQNSKGNLQESFNYLENESHFDEVYCAIDDFSESDINRFVKLAEIHHFNLKFLQDQKEVYAKRLKTDFYNYLPVLSLQKAALNKEVNKLIKRVFDIVFSLVVLIFIMSWLTPLFFILIKLESKGSFLYKHTRNGINYKEFTCYKFRSLKVNKEIRGTYIKEKDARVTKIGKFMRKTSLDEMPQFYNVLQGDMSVVGPRPHMLSYTEDYSKQVDTYNFMYRHNAKPGITGLAQIKGYRGEIKTKEDIINRIKYDNFYIENWNLLLDIKIILFTIGSIFKGQKQAY